MRIDDLNRSVQSQETEKTGAVSPDATKSRGASGPAVDSDAAEISQLASNALDPNLNAVSAKSRDSRIETLRVQIERGEYNVSADDVAASIIDEHTIG